MKTKFIAALITFAMMSNAAADYVIKDGVGVTKTIKSGTVSGNILPFSSPVDGTGAPLGVVGNPYYITAPDGSVITLGAIADVAVSIGGAGTISAKLRLMTSQLAAISTSLSSTLNVSCVSGCSGSGSGAVTVIDGGDVTQGAIADAIASAGGVGTVSSKLRLATQQLASVLTALGSPMQQTGGTVTANLGTLGGAATETTLAAINTKTPALGQALAAASTPVILPAATIITLTPPTAVQANAGTNLNTSLLALETGGNLATIATRLAPCTPYHLPNGSAASNNSTNIRGSAGTLCNWTVISTATALAYLKVYDSATAPTCSSATNLKHVYPIPYGPSNIGAGIGAGGAPGETYVNGISFCLVGGGADIDNTNSPTGIYVEASTK